MDNNTNVNKINNVIIKIIIIILIILIIIILVIWIIIIVIILLIVIINKINNKDNNIDIISNKNHNKISKLLCFSGYQLSTPVNLGTALSCNKMNLLFLTSLTLSYLWVLISINLLILKVDVFLLVIIIIIILIKLIIKICQFLDEKKNFNSKFFKLMIIIIRYFLYLITDHS